MIETRTLPTADGELGLHVRCPDQPGPFPVVLYFHRGPGLGDGGRETMDIFVKAGFLVIAPDRYYREAPWLSFEPAELRDPQSPIARRFAVVIGGTTEQMVARDVAAVLDYLDTNPLAARSPMMCIGYCIGARSALGAMAAHPDRFAAGALLHPSFCVTAEPDSPHRSIEGLLGALYVGIGREDGSSSPELNAPLIEAVERSGAPSLVEVLDGADHGFAVPGGSYHEAAARQAYDRVLALFATVLERDESRGLDASS